MHNWIVNHGPCVALVAVLAAGAGCQIYEPIGGPPLGWKEHRRTVWDRLNEPGEPYADSPSSFQSGPAWQTMAPSSEMSRSQMERSLRNSIR